MLVAGLASFLGEYRLAISFWYLLRVMLDWCPLLVLKESDLSPSLFLEVKEASLGL